MPHKSKCNLHSNLSFMGKAVSEKIGLVPEGRVGRLFSNNSAGSACGFCLVEDLMGLYGQVSRCSCGLNAGQS